MRLHSNEQVYEYFTITGKYNDVIKCTVIVPRSYNYKYYVVIWYQYSSTVSE